MHWKWKQRHRQRLSAERGTIRKDWRGKVRIALAFPNRYAVAMSNLGFQSVYAALNEVDHVVCERVFYPETADLPHVKQHPGSLLSLESQRPVREFDLVAFSVPYENDYSHVVEMLSLAGIEPRAARRSRESPVVAAGGVAVILNPEPLSPFMDFFFIGEAEGMLPDLEGRWGEFPERRDDRPDFLHQLAREVSGIYVPSLYTDSYLADGTLRSLDPVHKDLPEKISYGRGKLDRAKPSRTVVLTPETEFSDVTLLEIGRGCGRGCRFCAAGYVYRPVRFHAGSRVVDAAAERLGESPRVGLVSAAVSDHPEIDFICRSLLDRGASLSFSSLRADGITPEIASTLEAGRHQAAALAPEAGSDRLRKLINKNLTVEQVHRAVKELVDKGVMHLKLYFMIGLPTETAEDLEAVVDLVKGIRHEILKSSRGRTRLGTVTLSVHSFVPKPFTPFQWAPFAGVRELKDRGKRLQRTLQKVANVRVHFDLPKWAYVQALLSRGDRRVASILEKVALEGVGWTQAMRSAPANPDFWVMRERGKEEIFPWEIVDLGLKKSFLWEEYRRALRGEPSPPCRPHENCRRCGVCAP